MFESKETSKGKARLFRGTVVPPQEPDLKNALAKNLRCSDMVQGKEDALDAFKGEGNFSVDLSLQRLPLGVS